MKYLESYQNTIKNINRKLKNEKDPEKIQSLIDEIKNDILNDDKFDFIPYQVYISKEDGPFCFVGKSDEKEFKNLCLVFNDNNTRFSFIVWNDWIKSLAKPLNVDFIDYIINNNLFDIAEKSIKRLNFLSSPTPKEKKMAYNFRNNILSDDRFKIAQSASKYNL